MNAPQQRGGQAEALQVIANWPITDPKNMDAVNMASVAREALGTLPTAMSWIDSEGVHHSMSFDAARDLIKKFFEQWPGGLGEVEASVDGWRRKALTSAPPAPSVPTDLLDQFEPGGAEEVLRTYLKLHESRFFAHWLWCAVQQIAAGHGEAEVMSGFGYAPSVGGWQDIASAPKDGSVMLLWLRSPWSEPRIAYWYEPWGNWQPQGYIPDAIEDEVSGIGSDVPIAWAPLPQPPKEKP